MYNVDNTLLLLKSNAKGFNITSTFFSNGIKVVCLVNIKDYLSDEEILELYLNANYNKIHIVLVESREAKVLSNEKICIIDKDKCIIKKTAINDLHQCQMDWFGDD